MDRQSLYEIYQENLELLENEMQQVKKMTQINLGRLYYEKAKEKKQGNIPKLEYDVLGSTRLYTFLLCSWLEAWLKKILYENSSAAFTEMERESILSARKMSEKWTMCLNMSVCKSYGFSFCLKKNDYSADFAVNSEELQNYQKVSAFLAKIEQAITVRNRLAHGQWSRPLNSRCTGLAEQGVYDFFSDNDNIQKLDLLHKIYKDIAEIISAYVVYKDKVLTQNFKKEIEKRIEKIVHCQRRIEKSDLDNYCKPFYRKECLDRDGKKIFMADHFWLSDD